MNIRQTVKNNSQLNIYDNMTETRDKKKRMNTKNLPPTKRTNELKTKTIKKIIWPKYFAAKMRVLSCKLWCLPDILGMF